MDSNSEVEDEVRKLIGSKFDEVRDLTVAAVSKGPVVTAIAISAAVIMLQGLQADLCLAAEKALDGNCGNANCPVHGKKPPAPSPTSN